MRNLRFSVPILQLLQFVDWFASVAVALVVQGSTVWVFNYGGLAFGLAGRMMLAAVVEGFLCHWRARAYAAYRCGRCDIDV